MRVFVDGQEMPGVVNVEFRTETIDVSSSLVSHTVHAPGERTLHITTEIPDRQRSLVDQMAEYVQRYIPEARLAFDSRPIPMLVCQECRRRTGTLDRGMCHQCANGEQPISVTPDRIRCAYSADCGNPPIGRSSPFCAEHTLGTRVRVPTLQGPEPTPIAVPDPAYHDFRQDPDESPARLCAECGMWPEHHNHGGYSCICQECDPDGDEQSDTSIYAERSRSDFLAETTDSMTVEGDGPNIQRGEE